MDGLHRSDATVWRGHVDVYAVGRNRMSEQMDKISLETAMGTDAWKFVWAGEPDRKIAVEMTYNDLMEILKLMTGEKWAEGETE